MPNLLSRISFENKIQLNQTVTLYGTQQMIKKYEKQNRKHSQNIKKNAARTTSYQLLLGCRAQPLSHPSSDSAVSRGIVLPEVDLVQRIEHVSETGVVGVNAVRL